MKFVVAFSPRAPGESLPNAAATFSASTEHWRRFWTQGAAVELAESNDNRALELERRIVLSQYLTAIQCSGSLPPQETGLTVNSWYGKFHLEMHWWHAAHFALWNRLPLLEKSLGWYARVLPSARRRMLQDFPRMVPGQFARRSSMSRSLRQVDGGQGLNDKVRLRGCREKRDCRDMQAFRVQPLGCRCPNTQAKA
jgi:hypothetical protein